MSAGPDEHAQRAEKLKNEGEELLQRAAAPDVDRDATNDTEEDSDLGEADGG